MPQRPAPRPTRTNPCAQWRPDRRAAQEPLVDALATLNERQRVAVVLRYYEDLSEAEIAVALGCRPGTVKSLLHRGLSQLREVIEQ